jgi:hypothetical protein
VRVLLSVPVYLHLNNYALIEVLGRVLKEILERFVLVIGVTESEDNVEARVWVKL